MTLVTTTGGNGNGQDCSFPFIYQGEKYDKCLWKEQQYWCSVTPNFDKHGRWGVCPDKGMLNVSFSLCEWMQLVVKQCSETSHSLLMTAFKFWKNYRFVQIQHQSSQVPIFMLSIYLFNQSSCFLLNFMAECSPFFACKAKEFYAHNQ